MSVKEVENVSVASIPQKKIERELKRRNKGNRNYIEGGKKEERKVKWVW